MTKSELMDKKNGTVGKISKFDTDGNPYWADKTEEEQNEIMCIIEEREIGTFIPGDKITFRYSDGSSHTHHFHIKK